MEHSKHAQREAVDPIALKQRNSQKSSFLSTYL